MRSAARFYEDLHEAEKSYSGGTYYYASLYSCNAFRDWISSWQGQSMRLIDVGVGKGFFFRDFLNTIKAKWNIQPSRVTGLDLVRSSGNAFSEISPQFEFIEHDSDGNPLPFPDASFDFISCNHVVEHVFDTEKLIREFRRILSPNGLCIISVPNLAAWINRVAFLFAGQPLGSELGTEKVTYGFWPTSLQKRLEPFRPSGHIRDFTPRGLRDLTRHCGFETVGWWPQSPGLLARLSKWSGRNIGILLRPAKTTSVSAS
jgi:ubiquinone/menaquinone biosynthesis C-methylase UbiE